MVVRYLAEVELAEWCFLQEALYWVAFQRLPYTDAYADPRDWEHEHYKTQTPYSDGTLNEDECQRFGIPRDPRDAWDWWQGEPFHWMLSDPLETVIERAGKAWDGGDKIEIASSVQRIHGELMEWKPSFERVIELPTTKIYGALREGKISAEGVILPDPNAAAAMAILEKDGKKLSELQDVEISQDFWSYRNILWEESAALNGRQHYCQIKVPTEELFTEFPPESLMTPVSQEVKRWGAFFTLEGGRATSRRRFKKPKFDWNTFESIHADLVARNELPEKMEAAAKLLTEKMTQLGKDPPGRSATMERLRSLAPR